MNEICSNMDVGVLAENGLPCVLGNELILFGIG